MCSIEFCNVRRNYKNVNLLENIEFKINQNKIYMLIVKEKTLIIQKIVHINKKSNKKGGENINEKSISNK